VSPAPQGRGRGRGSGGRDARGVDRLRSAPPGRGPRGGLTAIRLGIEPPERAPHPSLMDPPSGRGPASPEQMAPSDPSEGRDPYGKLALFSGDRPSSPLGSFFLECSDCRRETPVSLLDLVRAALPVSVHLPFLRRYHSLMRCPACGRRTWLRLHWQL
jgi:hypothetical protein